MELSFFLNYKYDIDKGKRAIAKANELLSPFGVQLRVEETLSKNNPDYIFKTLYVCLDEDTLTRLSSRKNPGRPVKYHTFDFEKVSRMKAAGMTYKEIYTELGMSRTSFFDRLRECRRNIGQKDS